jgi:hypothetical protein
VDDSVLGRSAALQREVKRLKFNIGAARDGGVEHPQRLVQQFLPGLVAFQHDNGSRVHGDFLRSLKTSGC